MPRPLLPPLLPAKLIKSWDAHTINHHTISSADLMERAANTFCNWFSKKYTNLATPVIIIAGNGNNGGDGLAIARILTFSGYYITLIIDSEGKKFSADRITNFNRLPKNEGLKVYPLERIEDILISRREEGAILIDAIFGTGITNPIRDPWNSVIEAINLQKEKYTIVSIDLPSGLPSEGVPHWPCIEADLTFSFEIPKLSLLCPENSPYSRSFIYKPIGLDPGYLNTIEIDKYYLAKAFIQAKIPPRNKFDHKGTNGAVFQFCGSPNMPGAAILSVLSAFKAGAGYVYLYHPGVNPNFILSSCPEAIVTSEAHIPEKANVILAGCGIGISPPAITTLKTLLNACNSPLVLDADALNIISDDPDMLLKLPANTIITPHPGEFDRLFGVHTSHADRWVTQQKYSKDHGLIIVLKGAHTTISDPDGNLYFNSTGNPALAKAGSGDVLAGMIAAFIAQGSTPLDAALSGVYIHGLAADIAIQTIHERSLLASQLTTFISDALRTLHEII